MTDKIGVSHDAVSARVLGRTVRLAIVLLGLLAAPASFASAQDAQREAQGDVKEAVAAIAAEGPAADPRELYGRGMEAEWAGQYARARALHGEAAALGHAPSHYQLGFLTMDGLGGPRDVEAARQHLRAAADQGIDLALVAYLYAYDDQDDPALAPDAFVAGRALLELAQRDLASAGDTIMFWSRPLRRQVQVYLRDAGYYHGAIDGLIGQGSLRALRAFARGRSPLPELPLQRFTNITISETGIASDDADPVPFDAIGGLADARAAFRGAAIAASANGDWHVSSEGTALIDWPSDGRPEETGGIGFHLPGAERGASQGARLRIGMAYRSVAAGDLGVCAVRVDESIEPARYARRCETRVAGVHVEFRAANGPYDDLDVENRPDATPIDERLTAIVLSPPLTLRLADN